MAIRPKNDIVEIFGYAPDDLTQTSRILWDMGACPFISKSCTKTNHDQTIVYGTCSVTTAFGDCIICPNRFYENNYATLRKVASDAFGDDVEFFLFDQFISRRTDVDDCIVALGHNSGREVKLAAQLSMDWVLARVRGGKLLQYVGVEVQSIDITNNYRDTWHSYKHLTEATEIIPKSCHGLNWANVHKRLIPQLIRKGLIYSRSSFVPSGLYFILPEIVYRKFEDIVGADVPLVGEQAPDVLTVHTYSLSQPVQHSQQRHIVLEREIRFKLAEFSRRFITGSYLPTGEDMDNAVRRVLGVT